MLGGIKLAVSGSVQGISPGGYGDNEKENGNCYRVL